MSNMSFMERLLDGIEMGWPALGDLCEKISSGKNKEKCEDGLYPVFGSTGIIGRTNNKGYEKVQILVARVGANAGRVNIAQGEYDVSDNTLIVQNKENIILKYLYYYLVNINLNLIAQGAGQLLITAGQLKSIQIPIPCPEDPKKSLEIQAEIVRILDTFTELTTQLTTELNARKKQYNYYREKLLTEVYDSTKEFTIGEVLDMRAGKNIKAKDIAETETSEHKYTCYGGNGSRGFVSNYSHDGNYVLIGRQGALCGNVKRDKGKFYATEHAVVCSPKDGINIDWVFYMLTFMNLNQYKSKSAQPGLAVGNIAKLPIKVPPFEEQNRIVAILNKFEALTSSITEGLPREIALRQQQYEYYRNLLLSFPKPDAKVAA